MKIYPIFSMHVLGLVVNNSSVLFSFFFFFELVNVYSKFTTGPSTDFTLMIYTDQA